MENVSQTNSENLNVPDQIFQKFFEDLKKTDIAPTVIEALQIAVFAKENPSEVTIKAALFPQNITL